MYTSISTENYLIIGCVDAQPVLEYQMLVLLHDGQLAEWYNATKDSTNNLSIEADMIGGYVQIALPKNLILQCTNKACVSV